MNTIVAVLIYLGIAASPSEVTPEMISRNQSTIEITQSDPNFKNYWNSQYGSETLKMSDTETTTIVITDWTEGD